jgi:hypothetical protein
MNHKKVLEEALKIVDERGEDYGTVAENFAGIAAIFSKATTKTLTPNEIAILFAATKLSRMKESPKKLDHYVDAINYLAFAAELASSEPPLDESEESDFA